jgi:FdhD protein
VNEFRIVRYQTGHSPESARDELSVEEPLEIRVKNRAVSVTMRTPGHDEELAAGFLLTEGMIHSRGDVTSIQPCAAAREGNVINVALSTTANVDFDKLTRHVFASSSCGVCGKATIDSIHTKFAPIDTNLTVDAQTLLGLPEKLRHAQSTFDRTGGLHAAGLFTLSGDLVVAREDVGRHNAVDKVLGYGLLNNLLPFDRHILLVSGRASFEIMQKALAGRIPIVAAVSAPSSLAVDFAAESGMTLVGFLREGRMNIYTEPTRVRFEKIEDRR